MYLPERLGEKLECMEEAISLQKLDHAPTLQEWQRERVS